MEGSIHTGSVALVLDEKVFPVATCMVVTKKDARRGRQSPLALHRNSAQNKKCFPSIYWKQKTGLTIIPEEASLVLLGEVDLILGALRCGLACDQILPEFVILFKNFESIGLVKKTK